MSLYNMLHGYERTAGFVLNVLNLDPSSSIPRFRDAYVTYRDLANPDGDLVMVILTRTGGGNREEYAAENDRLCALTGYLDDADDKFDGTFVLFRYMLPEEYTDDVRNYLIENGPPLSLREKTDQAVGPDRTMRQKRATDEISKTLMEKLGKIVAP